MHTQRQAQKKKVPERVLVGEDVVEAVVGKAKQGNKKFVYWSKPDGSSYAKDTCT